MVIDNNVLELVNTESTGNYGVIINNNNNKIAAIDFTLANGIYEKTNVYTMTFKAIGEGNTTITLKNGELCDKSSDLDFNVESLNINIQNLVIEEPVLTTYNTYIEEKNVDETINIENIMIKKEKKIEKVNRKTTFVEYIVKIFNKIFKI